MDAERFRLVVQAHQRRTFAAAYRVVGNREEALDVAQEAFLALYEHRDSVREESQGAWLKRVATNRALDRLRRSRKQRPLADPEARPAAEPGPAERLARREEHALVLDALAHLSDRQREVLTMRVWDAMSFPEIRTALRISEGAAKVHFRRGLQALRRRLAAFIAAGGPDA